MLSFLYWRAYIFSNHINSAIVHIKAPTSKGIKSVRRFDQNEINRINFHAASHTCVSKYLKFVAHPLPYACYVTLFPD